MDNPHTETGGTPRKPRKLGLRTAMILGLCAFGLLLSVPPTWYNYIRSSEAALEVASEQVRLAGDEALLRTRLLIEPLHQLADHAAALPGSASRIEGFEHPLLPLQLNMLHDNPQLYSTYFAEGDGSFLQAVSLAGRPAVAHKLGAPAGARFALRLITVERAVGYGAGGGAAAERWRFLDQEHAVLAEKPPTPADYDPRTRPWYVRASQMDGPVRTDLYLFSSTGELGLTVARRIPAGRPLVFGADMTLESLSRFLGARRMGASGLLFMFDSEGGVIGYPDATRVRRPAGNGGGGPSGNGLAGNGLERARVPDLGDTVADAAFALFEAGGRKELPLTRLSAAGADYLCQVRRVEELGGPDDYLALVAKVDDFTAPLARTRNASMLFALGLILCAIPVLGALAATFGKGLIRLACEADRIRRLDLESTERLESPIAEMDQLGTAVAGMRSALHSSVRYLSKSLVKQFLESGVDPVLGGERREITLLFTDVQDFTPLAETLPPEELMQAMSQYFEAVAQAILDAGGTIDKFIGDAVMAFWNAPAEDPDHVAKACLAALRLAKASAELNDRRAAENLPLLRTRVGIHTGAAVVGNVGASDRMDYTALGANVNLASRLEGLNKFYATGILVSGEVRQRAKGQFLFRSVDVVVPKGASGAHAVFELVGALPASPHADVAAPRALLGFCSRWERAITLYRTAQWDKALAEFTALCELRPEDRLATMYATRTRRLLENKQGRDWKAIMRFKDK